VIKNRRVYKEKIKVGRDKEIREMGEG